MQAAVLRVKLRYIDEFNEARRRLAHAYSEKLAAVEGIAPPFEAAYGTHVYHQYTIRVTEGRRDQLKDHLVARGIGTMIYYPIPVHELAVYSNMKVDLPVAEEAAREALSLPMGPVVDESVKEKVLAAISDVKWAN
ncbi:MAG: erythromycin biosynthesis sensory transduction protein eryC1, partial [Gammaproteobacteria bacterium]|nr:erythromycin biosynthesis sensory transduction protein eryC1 [Gammaproteobacteria bacterium]